MNERRASIVFSVLVWLAIACGVIALVYVFGPSPARAAETETLDGPACQGDALPIGEARANLERRITLRELGRGNYLEAGDDRIRVIIALFEYSPVAWVFVFAGGCLISFDARAFAPMVVELLQR